MEEGHQHALLTKCYLGNEINKYDICKACGMHGRQMYTGFWLENLMEETTCIGVAGRKCEGRVRRQNI